MKPIFKRKVWGVLEKIAHELRLASDHETNPETKAHIIEAERIATDYILKDMKAAEKCQRR